MEQPQGYQVQGNQVCHLLRSLYGLKQAPRVWNSTLHQYLVSIGFVRLDSDYGLYARKVGESVAMMLTVYVDDLLLLGPSAMCERVQGQLSSQFELTELGTVKYLLGIEVVIDRDNASVFYTQENYVQEVLQRYHMLNCNGCATPEYGKDEYQQQHKHEDYMPYREVVGALQYLVSGSRPDIAHAVRNLGQYLTTFTEEHLLQAKRVLRYLKATASLGIYMQVSDRLDVKLEVYTDADYANDKVDRQSVSGYVTQVDGNTVSYGSRKQGLNAQSTAEAEYVAMNEGTRDLMWLVGLCDELGVQYQRPPLLISDNVAALYMTQKPGKHSKTKHIENRFHYVRHLVKQCIGTRHCKSENMPADMFTKSLARDKYDRGCSMLKMISRDRI